VHLIYANSSHAAAGNFIVCACPNTLRLAGSGDTAQGVVLSPDLGFPRGWPRQGES
jgi:hypothetical protein